MAARENQGLQIALIIFAVLTVLLGVLTYVYFDKWQEENTKLTKSETAAKTAVADSDNAKAELAEMKTVLGAEGAETLKDIQERHNTDMTKYGPALPEAKKHYRQLVEYLEAQVRSKDAMILTQEEKNKELTAKIASDEAVRKSELDKYVKQADATVKDKDAERDKFNADRTKFKGDAEGLAKTVDEQRKKFEKDLGAVNKTVEEYVVQIKKLDRERSTLIEEREVIDTASKSIDGKIVWVNQRAGLVWLDLGAADGLKQQISFAVLPAGDSGASEGTQKGSIEVTRVVGPHMAEARIVEDDASNPFMPGDQLLSAVWEAGRAEHFALAGFMDIDGDEASDRKLVRDLVLLNGGVIDAELTDDGEFSGEVTVSTRYLILGERPTEAAVTKDKDKGEQFLKDYARIIDQAAKAGVKTLNVEAFMKHIGYDARQRAIPLGKDARGSDFKATFPEGVQRKSTGPVIDFTPRKPNMKRDAKPKPADKEPAKKSAY